MTALAKSILAHSESLPEGAPICAKALLHLGSRAAVDQGLSRLAREGRLLRFSRGVYLRPVQGRFGQRSPSAPEALEAFAHLKGATIVPHGAAAANRLGLSPQVPLYSVYLTSGPTQRLTLGKQTIELRHAPRWQLLMPNQPAGDAIRALAWLGREKVGEALGVLRRRLSATELENLASVRPQLPSWLAAKVSELVRHG
ncbi:DUF6088 family protein [Aquibaculum sediminis]|uniref:DUF6088 family protein n=1 Tax=Aquibaculum sediminis TaxID=3231907 RepID=UPI0034537E85